MTTTKKLSILSGTIIALLIFFYACKTKPETANTTEAVVAVLDGSGDAYLVDTLASQIEWVGATPGNYQHNGIIRLASGKFTVNNNQLTSGKFTISINSINNLDQTGKDKVNLEEHLKNEDFFDAKKFPFGSFEITSIRADSLGQIIVGNLTLKDKTNSIEIPAKVKIDEKFIIAETPSFTIDRTKWGIVYNSGIIGTVKDNLINDEISLKLKVVASK